MEASREQLSAADLLDAYTSLVQGGWPYPELIPLRAELLRRLADRDRLAGVVRRALDAGHCHPAAGSDAGECLVDHCALALRDLIALRQDVVRLLEALAAIRQAAARPRPEADSRAALEQIAAAATDALAASGPDVG